MTCIGVVSPGAMGSAIGRGYAEAGARVVATASGRSERTRELAHRLELLPGLEEVVAAADVVLSIVPPAEALAVAAAVAGAASAQGVAPLFADLNAVAPATMERIAAAVAPLRLVDGSISGGPPNKGSARVYLSGPQAQELASIPHPRLDVRVVSPDLGAASAVKMCTASVYKGVSAILVQALRTAHSEGVLAWVVDDLQAGYPELMRDLAPRLASTASKAHRFVGEMREIAATQAAQGLPPDLFEAMATTYAGIATTPLGHRTPEQARDLALLDEVLDMLRT